MLSIISWTLAAFLLFTDGLKTFWSYRNLFSLIIAILTFQCLRAVFHKIAPGLSIGGGFYPASLTYGSAPFEYWILFAVVMIQAANFFMREKDIQRITAVCTWAAFFIAIHKIFSLSKISFFGEVPQGYFLPILYRWEWAQKYIFSQFAHSNYTGDIIAAGFFPALGVTLYYFLLLWKYRQHRIEIPFSKLFAKVLLYGTLAASSALGIFLFLSRGTILFFMVTLLLYLLLIFMKLKRKIFMGTALFLVFLMALLFGDISRIQNELLTLQQEKIGGTTSINTNVEGAQRALRIFQAYPLWGIGTFQYARASAEFASPGTDTSVYKLANFQSMNHYLQILAEEGVGAFLYFALLALYGVIFFRSLFKTQSRYQFIMGLSFFAPVCLFLLHGLINHLLEHFSFRLLLFTFIGISLGIVRKDFKFEPEQYA